MDIQKEITQLAIEISYAQPKEVEITVDEWEEKIRVLLKLQREETAKEILRKIRKRRNEALNLKGYHPNNSELARKHISGLDIAEELLKNL